MLPEDLRRAAETCIGRKIVNVSGVSGGCVGNAARLETEDGSYFLKWGSADVAKTFEAEGRGLSLLAATGTQIRIPEVIGISRVPDGRGMLILEWIEAGPMDPSGWSALGQGLAEIHQTTSRSYGLDAPNFIGLNPQKNDFSDNWPEFFRRCRLLPQAQMARAHGSWTHSWHAPFDRLCLLLDEILPTEPEPSLVHGDLWTGNVLLDQRRFPVLVDPAVYFGHREVGISMSTLFGRFGDEFYGAYDARWPLQEGWEERFEIYNLYHLLNHLNLFGRSYESSVAAVLLKF